MQRSREGHAPDLAVGGLITCRLRQATDSKDALARGQLFLDLQLTQDGTPGDSSALISTTALEKGVLAVPGIGFLPNPGVSSFVRVSFSLATEEDAELGFQRLRECILEARGEKST